MPFAIYAVGFLARPIGAFAIFGHYGDSRRPQIDFDRDASTGMGIAATFLIAFVPTYDKIGIWGAYVILTALRFFQGIGVGGEWGAARC